MICQQQNSDYLDFHIIPYSMFWLILHTQSMPSVDNLSKIWQAQQGVLQVVCGLKHCSCSHHHLTDMHVCIGEMVDVTTQKQHWHTKEIDKHSVHLHRHVLYALFKKKLSVAGGATGIVSPRNYYIISPEQGRSLGFYRLPCVPTAYIT